MSWQRGKTSSGWAAFDLNQRRKQGLESFPDPEPYPSLSTSITPLNQTKNLTTEKPFVSVLLRTVDFPDTLKKEINIIEKLKEHYPWADTSLIKDVLGGVDNNFDEASSLLKAMEPSNEDIIDHEKKNTLMVNNDDMKSVAEENKKVDTNVSLGNTRIYPVEPEWEEEEDVYLIHRKEAIKKMRSASHHSKVANDAYIRGDHITAQQSSRKAREEWAAAEKLNAEAAKEILNFRNSKNDLYTLDLHGLHASEAIHAVKEHLRKTESTISGNSLSIYLDSSSCNVELKGNGVSKSSLKSTKLEVITGKGNHSRGQAALPAAIRSFLNENGYHYDEARPGVITVRPKFRRQ